MRDNQALQALVRLKGALILEIAGRSMLPTLTSDDLVRITPPYDLLVGDVIAYPGSRSGRPVLHRIIEIDALSVQATGDNTLRPCQVPQEEVIGKLTAIKLASTEKWIEVSCWIGEAKEISRLSQRVASCLFLDDATPPPQLAAELANRLSACMRYRDALLRHAMRGN